MGYNIIRTELNDAALDCLNKTSVINDYLSKIEGGFQGLVDNKYFAGSGAETIKTYLECVQLTAIRVIQLAVVEYAQVFSSFAESFSIHDESYEAVFNEDYFDELLKSLRSLRTSLYENQVPAYNAETAVDDIIKEDYIKNYDVYDDPLTKVITDISYLSRCIKRRDINYKLNFQNVKDLIADAKCLVDKIKEKGVISFAEMSNASYLNISEAQKMQEDFKKGCDYLWRNQAELKKGVDYISQYAEYKNDKLAQKRSEHGLVLIGEAILGITLVISTAGAGAPLVLTTIAGACDVGLACEGVQETYYGAIKDIETPSINPVRDYICMGNQEAYDMLSMLSHNMCFASASINTIVSAGSGENIQALKEVVQIRTCAEVVTVNVAAPVGNYYIGKYATACTDNELVQFGIQVGGNLLLGAAIKGVAHINGMGAQKLASKYYLEKPNIGINTSGLTTSKTNEVTDFAAGMSPEDAERYIKYCDECEKGIHNNHPGLDEADIKAWEYGNAKVKMASGKEAIKLGRTEKGQTYALNENNALTYKSFEKETFSSGFDYESMYEHQYLDDFSYEEHFAGGDIEGITTKDPSGIKNQEISYASFEGEYEPIKLKTKDNYPESPMFGEDWNSYFQDKYGSKNVNWETRSVTSGGSESVYIPRDSEGNPIPLKKQRINGQDIPLPDPAAEGRPHTVLGGKVSSETGEVYRQSATFPGSTWPSANGHDVPWSEVHWTDHGTSQFHTNPHEHIFEYNPDKGGWIRKEPSDF